MKIKRHLKNNAIFKIIIFCIAFYLSSSLQAQTASDYRADAERGDKTAQFNLGLCYYRGNGVDKDYTQAVYWLRKAAEQGHALAQYNIGSYCEKNEDYNEAVYWYQKAAEQGEAEAQYKLGQCYIYAKGVLEDFEQAAYWHRKAAEQGHMIAQAVLGFIYEAGYGNPEDSEQAAYWYRKAAEQGHRRAQYKLAQYHKNSLFKKLTEKRTLRGSDGDLHDGCVALYWYEKALQNENGNLEKQEIKDAKQLMKLLKKKFAAYPLPK